MNVVFFGKHGKTRHYHDMFRLYAIYTLLSRLLFDYNLYGTTKKSSLFTPPQYFQIAGQLKIFHFPVLINNLNTVRCFNKNNEYLKMSRKQQILWHNM